MQTIMPLTNA